MFAVKVLRICFMVSRQTEHKKLEHINFLIAAFQNRIKRGKIATRIKVMQGSTNALITTSIVKPRKVGLI